MRTYKFRLHLWYGPNEIEPRGYIVQAESFFWALYTAVIWARARRRGGIKAKSVSSYELLAIR